MSWAAGILNKAEVNKEEFELLLSFSSLLGCSYTLECVCAIRIYMVGVNSLDNTFW